MTNTTRRIKRGQHYRGMEVRVELRHLINGTNVVTGEVSGWGTQVLGIYPDQESKANGWTWKRHEISNVSISAVYAL